MVWVLQCQIMFYLECPLSLTLSHQGRGEENTPL